MKVVVKPSGKFKMLYECFYLRTVLHRVEILKGDKYVVLDYVLSYETAFRENDFDIFLSQQIHGLY